MSTQQGPEQRLQSMTTAAIENTLCYCTTLTEFLNQKEANTEVAEYELAVVKSKLDKLKTVLNEQSTIDGINTNVIEQLIEQLQVIAQKRETTFSLSSLDLQQACTLHIIIEKTC